MRARHLLSICAAVAALTPTRAPAHGTTPLEIETVVSFDPSLFETPESIAIDHRNNRYISLALTGEIRKIAPDGAQSTLAFLPIHPEIVPCGNAFGVGIMGGLALDHQGNVYVSVGSCDTTQTGVWRVTPEGEATHIAALGAAALPNGIAFHNGWLYVADTALGHVWRIPADGDGPAEVWASDPLLAPLPDFFPGPNGLQIYEGEVYVAVSDQAHVVAIPISEDGSAGAIRVHASGIGLDDFAFDVEGNLYGTTDPFNTVVKVTPDGSVEVLFTAGDGLDGPTAAAFGRGADSKHLYITNAAFPFFSTTHEPSLMRVHLGTPGYPR